MKPVCRIGEGTVRTILRRLKSMDLVSVSRTVASMTAAGCDFMKAAGVSVMDLDPTDSAIGAYQVALLVRGKADAIGKGIEQRNCAIRVGADGCTTIVCREGSLILPPDWDVDERTPALASQIRRYGVSEGDMVLIGGSDASPGWPPRPPTRPRWPCSSEYSLRRALALLAPGLRDGRPIGP